jgi:putative hydrolase of the HAD superfamily
MPFTTLLFDLDDTLYPPGNGLWAAIRERMGQYMIERIGLPAEEVPTIRQRYYQTYGTTLRGLLANYPDRVNADDYLAYVHDLPLEDYIQPDPKLRQLLLTFPQQRWIFTNADANHARRVLNVLGLRDCFAGIVDVRGLGLACKPDPQAYRRALAIVGEPNPACCVLLDDAVHNLAPAHSLGFTTVLVGTTDAHPVADYSIASLYELPNALPELRK